MAFDINSVFLIGRLTKDPETRFSASTAVCKFSLANNTGKEDKDVSFFNIVTFGKVAERCQQYLRKGSQIGISGRLSQNRWEKDGQKFSRVEVIGINIQFLDKKSDSFAPSNNNNQYNNPTNEPEPDSYNEVIDEEDDIPF